MEPPYVVVPLENVHGREEREQAQEIREYVDGIGESYRNSYVSRDGWVLVCDDPQGVVNGTKRSVAVVNRGDDGRTHELRIYKDEHDPAVELQREYLAEHCRTTPAYASFVRGSRDRRCMQWLVGPPVGDKKHHLVYENGPIVSTMTPPESAREIIRATGALATIKNLKESFRCIAANTRHGVYYATKMPKEGAPPYAAGAWKYGYLVTQQGTENFFLGAINTRSQTKTRKGKSPEIIPDKKLTAEQRQLHSLLETALVRECEKAGTTLRSHEIESLSNSIAYHDNGMAAVLKWTTKPALFLVAYRPALPESYRSSGLVDRGVA